MKAKNVSVIIPTYNEELIIEEQLKKLTPLLTDALETIIVDASSDSTFEIASRFDVHMLKSSQGRAIQMNAGAKIAKGDMLCFLHLDTEIPSHFIKTIEKQRDAGCFQMKFDDTHWLMRIYGWCTCFPFLICRGGDQVLYVERKIFEEIGGFNNTLLVMEDIEIIQRIKKISSFNILKEKVITSARKYKINGRIRLQLIFGMIHLMYALGFKQEKIIQFYRSKVR